MHLETVMAISLSVLIDSQASPTLIPYNLIRVLRERAGADLNAERPALSPPV